MSFQATHDAADVSSSEWNSLESEELRRLHDSVVAAAELLKQDERGLALAERAIPGEHPADHGFQLADLYDGRFALTTSPRHGNAPALRTLKRPGTSGELDDLFGLSTMLKLGAAAGLAVGVAITTLNPASPLQTAFNSWSKSQTFSIAALTGLAEIGSAEAKVQPESPVLASASAMLAASQANIESEPAAPSKPIAQAATPALAAFASAILPPATATAMPEMVAPHAPEPTPPATAAAPAPRPVNALAHDEVATLMKRGRNLLAEGDIASARLILERLANHGEAEASLLLAGTFDPTELARLHVIGATSDSAQARAWYAKAAEQGSSEGSRRLQQMASR